MTQDTSLFNPSTFDGESEQIFARLSEAMQEDILDIHDRMIVADKNARLLQNLRIRLEQEWRRLLITERDANSKNIYLSLEERLNRERALFAQALDLLPLARKLTEIEMLIAQLRGQSPHVFQGTVDEGLQALQKRDDQQALILFAHAGDPDTVADEVQNRREDEADNLLQAARTAYAQAGSMPYDDLKREVQEQYLDPVWLIGREFHREMVQRFFEQIPTEKLEGAPLVPSDSVIREEPPGPLSEEEPLPIADPVGRNEKRALLMLGGGALFLLLIVGSALAFARGSGSPPQPATTTASAGAATAQTGTAAAGAVDATGTPTVTASPTLIPSSTPTITVTPVPIVVKSIEPKTVFVRNLPIMLTVSGDNLNWVQGANLVAPNRIPIPLEILSPLSNASINLVLKGGAEKLNGEVAYTLELNGTPYEAAFVRLRDYSEIRTVKGVKQEYLYTGRVADDNGLFTGMRVVRDVASERTGTLRNDDQVEILRDEGDGWYLVRIRTSSDPNQIGVEGWIERWLVDDKTDEVPTPVPTLPPPPAAPIQPTAAPRPQVRYFSAGSIVSYAGSGDSGRFESCVTGSVSGSEGAIIGAVVNVNNGGNSFDATTGGGGFFRVCGLGASNWTAVLYFVPGTPTGNQPAVTVYVNGLPDQHAVVSFTQQ